MITNVKNMMKERLTEYQNRNKKLPERIIIFRGGVSEGQFDIVLKDEAREIKAAFRAFKSYNPSFSATSADDIAFGTSCLFAYTRTGRPFGK